jgi:hypothetical protein
MVFLVLLLQGKTLQAIAIVAAYRAEWPCLIVTPSSLRGAPLKYAHFSQIECVAWWYVRLTWSGSHTPVFPNCRAQPSTLSHSAAFAQ